MISIYILITLILLSPAVFADDDTKVYDTQWNKVYTVRESSNGDQKVYDTQWNKVGTIRDGKIYDSKWNKVGTTTKGSTSKGGGKR
jgi:hypothetical protein